MSSFYPAAQIAVIALVTMALRFLPFLIFGKGKQTPKYISYLGTVLPPAIMGMLVIYCLKGISFGSIGAFLPALLSVMAVVLLHVWKRQTLLSIVGGTVLYMVLLNIM